MVLVCLLELLVIVINMATVFFNTKETTTTEKQSEPNPYLAAKYQLKTQGKHYEKVLTAGEYIVGLDLPEGIYQVSIQKGKNSLSIKNRKQSISQYDFYKINAKADDNFYKTEEEVHLYQGSYVKIDQGGTMKFVTDCAQMDLMKRPAKNTLKKIFMHIPKSTGRFILIRA